MEKIYVVSLDEEFDKSRAPGAKDKKKRKKRSYVLEPGAGKLDTPEGLSIRLVEAKRRWDRYMDRMGK